MAKTADGDEKDPDRPRYFLQSLERGFEVIRAFDADHPAMTLADVARQTGMTRATARRCLLTLADLEYVRSDGRMFTLSPRVLDLGYAYLSGTGLPAISQPHLEALVAAVHHASSLAVLDGDDVVYVARVPVRRFVTISIAVGSRFPAYAMSLGRILLAAKPGAWLDEYIARLDLRPLSPRMISDKAVLRAVLEETRATGYCLTDEELETGLRSIAVPVHDAADEVVAAMNLSVPSGAESARTMKRVLFPKLRAAADSVENDLRAHRNAARARLW